MPSFIKIVQTIKKLNSISRARLNFRRGSILCTTLYRNPIQASKLWWHIWPTFPLNIFMKFSQKMPFDFVYTMVQESQKRPKTSGSPYGLIGVFWKPLFIHLPHPVGMWNFAQTFLLAIFHEIRWQKSCDIITSTVFKFKNYKSWQENIHVGMKNESSGGFVLLYGWNNEDVRWGFSLFKSIGKLWAI